MSTGELARNITGLIMGLVYKHYAGGIPIAGYSKTTHFRARWNAIINGVFMLALGLLSLALPYFIVRGTDKIWAIIIAFGSMLFIAYVCFERAVYYFRFSSSQVITGPDGLRIYGYSTCDLRKIKDEDDLATRFRKRSNRWVHLTWAQAIRIGRYRLNQGTGAALIIHSATHGDILLDLDCFPMRITAEISKYKQVEEIYSLDEYHNPHSYRRPTKKKRKRRKR